MSAVADARPAAPAKLRRRRWPRRAAGLLVLLAVGVWFAPAIAAKTSLPARIVRGAAADLRGTVEVGGASLGWLSPVELRDVVVKDRQGRVLLIAPKVTSSKSLLALAWNRADLGEFAVDRPAADVVCENGTTNLQDALGEYLKDDGRPPAPTRPAVAVRVVDGTLTVHDGDRVTEAGAIGATVAVPAPRSEPITAKLTAASPGKLDAELSVGERGTAKVAATGFPLDALAPVVRRLQPGLNLGGTLTADLSATWGHDEQGRTTAKVDGTIAGRDFDICGPWFKGDRLRLTAADLPLKVELTGSALRVERAELTCDIGIASASGVWDLDGQLDDVLERAGLTASLDIDLAKLAARVPHLLRLRPGTEVREGRLTAKLTSRATPAGTAWDGFVRTSALKAVRDGKPVEWAEPLAVEFTGRLPAGHLPTFDQFVCKSDFLAVNAQGSAESFRAAANVYLDRLSARLGEFVDLHGVQLAGEASAWVIASRSPAGAFKLDGGADLKDFAFADGHRHALAEKALSVKMSAAGTWAKGGPVRLDAGSVVLTAGADGFESKLVEPIPDARQFAAGKLSARLSGDLGRWAGRVRSFAPVPKHYEFGGMATASGTVRLGPEVVAGARLLVSIDKAKFHGAGLDIDEPHLNAAGDLTVNLKSGVADLLGAQLSSPALSVTGGKFTIEGLTVGELAVSGSGSAVGDLHRLGRTLRLTDGLRGRATGPARFRWQGDTTTFAGTLDLADVGYGDPAKTGLSERVAKLDLDGRYDLTPDRLTLNRAKFDRPGIGVFTKGTLAKFDGAQDVALEGTLDYDLAALAPELRQAVGGNFQASGKGSRPFAVSGSLASGKLMAEGGLGWDALKAYGFDVGRGELTAKFADGRGTISPISATFGGGRITLTPTVRLDTGDAEVSFAPGKVIDRATLTAQATAGALGYALPVIANATNPEGQLSLELGDNRIPLADFGKASVRGRILVHQASVGAGPVMTEVLTLLGQPSARMSLANEQAVPIAVEDGRVLHEGLALTVNGYTVKTTGSVGLDGSLVMVADVPIPGTFPGLKNNPALKKAVEGKIVKVPIVGTLNKPVVDGGALQKAVAEAARGAAKDVIRDSLNRELDNLLKPPAMKK
ncbi:MAG: hypothetical protein K2X87_27675 [Gemmataceae bacterium]|nr:hypothetical protein [Gemmataceae bacterium]